MKAKGVFVSSSHEKFRLRKGKGPSHSFETEFGRLSLDSKINYPERVFFFAYLYEREGLVLVKQVQSCRIR